jgi:glucose-6-phosphate 1-dehydrogenase
LCDFVFCARGELARHLTLPDIFIYNMENHGGEQPTVPVVAVGFKVSKKNTFQRIEHAGCLRAKDISTCAHGALATYFFELYRKLPDAHPKMDDRSKW